MVLDRAVAGALQRASSMLDHAAIRVMERTMSRGGAPPPADARQRLIRLAAHYRRGRSAEDSFFPAPDPIEASERSVEPRAGARTVVSLRYPSTYRPYLPEYRERLAGYRANRTAHARIYLGGEAPRPTVICLHGWGGGAFWMEERAFLVSYLLRIGLDVALFQLPFHGARAPGPRSRAGSAGAGRSGALFPSSNVVRTNEGFGQAIFDLRGLADHLRRRGAPAVGVMGMSLGGYTSALWASVDHSLAFSIPIIPAVSMSALMWRHGAGSPARRRAARVGVTQELLDDAFAIHSPLSRPLAVARERCLIVAGRGDRITPPDQAERLWAHWGEPAIHWFAGGHLVQIGRGDAFRAIRRHLAGIGAIAG